MTILRDIKKVQKDDLTGAPSWVEKLVLPINSVVDAIAEIASKFYSKPDVHWHKFKTTVSSVAGDIFVNAYLSSASAASAPDTWTEVVFDSVTQDGDGAWANNRFNVPRDGFYHIIFGAQPFPGYLDNYKISITVSRLTPYQDIGFVTGQSASLDEWLNISTITYLHAGDQVYFEYWTLASGGELDANDTWFKIFGPANKSSIPSNFPYSFICPTNGRPKSVFVGEIKDITDGSEVSASLADWDYTFIDNKPHVVIKNIPGLTDGHKYEITIGVMV